MEARIEALESDPHHLNLTTELNVLKQEIVVLRNETDATRERQTLAIGEGIEKVERAERRISATLARARKELKKRGYEDPGLEAEAHEFHDVNGAGGEEQRLPAVREALAVADEQASSIPNVPLATLQRARGIS